MPDTSPAKSNPAVRSTNPEPAPSALPSSPVQVNPRFDAKTDHAPLPISKLPPLRPPSAAFQALAADVSWSSISRSHLDPSETSVPASDPISAPASDPLPSSSAPLPAMPHLDRRLRSVLNPPVVDSGNSKQRGGDSINPSSSHLANQAAHEPNVEPNGGLTAKIDHDVCQEITQDVAPPSPIAVTAAPGTIPAEPRTVNSLRSTLTSTSAPHYSSAPPRRVRRRRSTRSSFLSPLVATLASPLTLPLKSLFTSPFTRPRTARASSGLTSGLTSWLNSRSAPMVYAATIGLGLLAFGAMSNGDDRLDATTPRLNVDCAGAISVNTTLTPETFTQLPAKIGQARAEVTQQLGTPYCTLPKVSIRYGAIAERDVYRLTDQRHVVVSYEDGLLVGIGIEGVAVSMAERPAWQAAMLSPTVSTQAETTVAGVAAGAAADMTENPPRLQEVNVQQSWGVQIGDMVGTASVVGSLGDVSLAHRGRVFAPVDGWVDGDFVTIVGEQLSPNEPDCVLFSSPQLPSYLMKTCGLVQRYLGAVEAGEPIGRSGGTLHVSLLSRRRDQGATSESTSDTEAEWVYVSPSPEFLAQAIEGDDSH